MGRTYFTESHKPGAASRARWPGTPKTHYYCRRCGRRQPASRLNVEGVIHHRGRLECLDRRECERAKRKRGRK